MKGLSIRQPWAWAILHAGKDIENRTWPTAVRGRIIIHTGKRFDDAGFTFLRLRLGSCVPVKNDFPLGGIVGSVAIEDCKTSSRSHWFFGPYGFLLREPEPLKLADGRRVIPYRGARGFFEVADAVRLEAGIWQ